MERTTVKTIRLFIAALATLSLIALPACSGKDSGGSKSKKAKPKAEVAEETSGDSNSLEVENSDEAKTVITPVPMDENNQVTDEIDVDDIEAGRIEPPPFSFADLNDEQLNNIRNGSQNSQEQADEDQTVLEKVEAEPSKKHVVGDNLIIAYMGEFKKRGRHNSSANSEQYYVSEALNAGQIRGTREKKTNPRTGKKGYVVNNSQFLAQVIDANSPSGKVKKYDALNEFHISERDILLIVKSGACHDNLVGQCIGKIARTETKNKIFGTGTKEVTRAKYYNITVVQPIGTDNHIVIFEKLSSQEKRRFSEGMLSSLARKAKRGNDAKYVLFSAAKSQKTIDAHREKVNAMIASPDSIDGKTKEEILAQMEKDDPSFFDILTEKELDFAESNKGRFESLFTSMENAKASVQNTTDFNTPHGLCALKVSINTKGWKLGAIGIPFSWEKGEGLGAVMCDNDGDGNARDDDVRLVRVNLKELGYNLWGLQIKNEFPLMWLRHDTTYEVKVSGISAPRISTKELIGNYIFVNAGIDFSALAAVASFVLRKSDLHCAGVKFYSGIRFNPKDEANDEKRALIVPFGYSRACSDFRFTVDATAGIGRLKVIDRSDEF